MKGSIGTSMQGIEKREHKPYNHHCSDCVYMEYVGEHLPYKVNKKCPYKCSKKGKPLYYTSKVMCNKFKHK